MQFEQVVVHIVDGIYSMESRLHKDSGSFDRQFVYREHSGPSMHSVLHVLPKYLLQPHIKSHVKQLCEDEESHNRFW